MTDVGPALGRAELDALEQRLGIPLPEPYRAFLVTHNGGSPTAGVFEIPGQGSDAVRQFFAVGGDRHSDLERKIRLYSGRIPGGTLPIGEDSFGNLLLLYVAGRQLGAVAFWDHERELEPSGTILLAESLSGFLRALRKDD